jgi:beta-lactamase superfamily II metal-dependent hydrolase
VIHANAIPGGHDIDVLKVAHHGSDTSSGKLFVESLRPELAIISSDRTTHRLPKLTSIKVLENTNATVLVTGRPEPAMESFTTQQTHSTTDTCPQRLPMKWERLRF